MVDILLVGHDDDLSNKVTDMLRDECSHRLEVALDAERAWAMVRSRMYGAIVVDLQFSGSRSVDFCIAYRKSGGRACLIMISSVNTLDAMEHSLDSGADFFLASPFDKSALLDRIATAQADIVPPPRIVSIGCCRFDCQTGVLVQEDKRVHLPPMEARLLEFLLRYRQQSFSAKALHERLWRDKPGVSVDTVRTHIKNLRRRIDMFGMQSRIVNERKRGYKLV